MTLALTPPRISGAVEAAYTALAVDDDAPVLQRGFASLEAALRHIGIAIKAKARADRVPPSGCPSALWACCERLQPLHIEYERLATGIRTIDLPKFTPRRRIMMTPTTTTAAMEQDQEENGEEREEVVTDKDTVMVPPPPTPPPRAPAPGFMSMPMAKQLPVLKAPLPPPIAAAAAAIPPPPPPATAKRQTPPPPPIQITAAPLLPIPLTTTKTAMAVAAAAAVPTTTSPLFNKFTPPSRTPPTPTTSASSQTPSPPTSAGRPIPVPTLSPTLSSPMLSPVYVSPLFLAPPPPPRSPKRPAETTTAAEDDGQQNVKRHKSKPKVAEILAALQASMDEMRARLDAVAPVVRTS